MNKECTFCRLGISDAGAVGAVYLQGAPFPGALVQCQDQVEKKQRELVAYLGTVFLESCRSEAPCYTS